MAGLAGGTDVAYSAVKSRADRLQAELTADLQAGQRELEAGKTSLTEANSKHDATLATEAVNHFHAAKDQFLAAATMADNSQLLRYLEYAPSVGDLARSRHKAVDGISQMGAAVSDAGQGLATLDGEIIKPPANGEAGRTLLTVLDQTEVGLTKVRDDFARADAAAAGVDFSVVPAGQQATFQKARDSITAALAGLTEFERLVPVLKEVLGGNGARTYLVEQVNPAELRAGGGFIGTFTVLRADDGALSVIRSGNAYELADPRPVPGQAGFIPQPTPYREVIPNVSWSFVDSNIYPDFPSNAVTAENFVQPRIGKVDGVISMDYYVVAQMLQITGPLIVPGFGIQVDANNFIAQALKNDIVGGVLGGEEKQILSALAGPLMGRISSLSPDRWPSLLATLNGLAGGRHLQAYFNNQTVENEVDRVGWSGHLNPPGTSDFLMELESNYYGTKTNYFLGRHYSIALTRNGPTLHHRISVQLVNTEPCGLEDRTLYKGDIRLYVGAYASSFSYNLMAVRYSNPAAPPGLQLMDGWLFVDCGGNRGEAVFDYNTPWPAHDMAGFQIYWQKQPGTPAESVDVAWNYGSGPVYRTYGDLSGDRVITLTTAGVTLRTGQPAQAILPSLSLG